MCSQFVVGYRHFNTSHYMVPYILKNTSIDLDLYRSNKLCSFCKKEEETYPHLFLFCEQVQRTWQEIINKLNLREIDISNWNLIFMGFQGILIESKCVIPLFLL